MSLDQLLDSLGFSAWLTITSSFIISSINLIGILLCSLSAYIFYHRKFKDPVFFYYRLLCLIYILHLLHGIPFGPLFSPRYFPHINTYISSMYLMYYPLMTSFLFHFEDTLQMAILIDRMKIYSPYVSEHFTAKPRQISFVFFLTCIFTDLPTLFSLKIVSLGNYSSTHSLNDTLYFFDSSDFSLTPFGQMLLGFTSFFLNLFLTLVVGLALNVISVCEYKLYLRQRRQRDQEYINI
jgi:hypothetical protein